MWFIVGNCHSTAHAEHDNVLILKAGGIDVLALVSEPLKTKALIWSEPEVIGWRQVLHKILQDKTAEVFST